MSQLRQQGLLRFDFLDGALPGRVNPTDIDQALERHGNFLFIECKRPNQRASNGQARFLDALAAGPRSVNILVVEGHPPDDIHRAAAWGQPLFPCDTDLTRAWVRWWWERAGQE